MRAAGLSFLGPVALGYLLLDFLLGQAAWLPQPVAQGVRGAVWISLAFAALSRVPAYTCWPEEARYAPLFLGSTLFLVGSLVFEAIAGVHFVTVLMGLDWHRSQQPLPDTGQWLSLWLPEVLPAPLTAALRAPLVGLHHFLMLFLMLAFSALFHCTRRPGFDVGAQYMRAMAWGRLLRTACFLGTILPSPRPWCASHRFQGFAAHPSPWASKYHVPYASDQMTLWTWLQHHRPAGGRPPHALESSTAECDRVNCRNRQVGYRVGPSIPTVAAFRGGAYVLEVLLPLPLLGSLICCPFPTVLLTRPAVSVAATPPSPPEFVPSWGPLHFLAPILRPASADSPPWFQTLKRAGGGCNDLIFSGHMLVAALTAMAFQDLYPGWTSAIVWCLVAHSGMREVAERHHYTADVVLGTFVGIMLWKATRPSRGADSLLGACAKLTDELQKAAKDGDIEKVRDVLRNSKRVDQKSEEVRNWSTVAFGYGVVVGSLALCLTVFVLCSNG